MATAVISTRESERVVGRRLWWAGPLTILTAVGVNVATRYIAGMLLAIPPEFEPLHYRDIILLTTAGVTGAVLTFAAISRVARRPIRLFRRVSVVALALSFVPDIGLLVTQAMPGATGTTVSLLMLLHVVAAVVCVSILTTLARD